MVLGTAPDRGKYVGAQAACNSRCGHRAAPGHLAGEDRLVVADHMLAHDGLDAISADDQVGMRGGAVLEIDRSTTAGFFDSAGLCVQHDGLGVKAAHGVLQGEVQVAAMDLEVGRAVLLLVLLAERNLVQQLAGVEAAEFEGLGPHGCRLEARAHADVIEHLDRVGAHLDARAHLAELGRLFEDAHLVAALQKGCGGGQPAQARADDDDVHTVLSNGNVVRSSWPARARAGAPRCSGSRAGLRR